MTILEVCLFVFTIINSLENSLTADGHQYYGDNTFASDAPQPQIFNPSSFYGADETENLTFNMTYGSTAGAPLDSKSYGYGGAAEYDEPPLLDELEIYPERIIEKSMAVLNPFHTAELSPAYLFEQTDLAGPILFCLTMAVALFVSGSSAHFGYIYGLCMISVFGMYVLCTLMCNTTDHFVSVTAVASILGYSLLPIVWLSVVGIAMSLHSIVGLCLAGMAVLLATVGASNIFCLMTGDRNQRFLLAYPCLLVYLIFVLLVLF